MRYVIPIVIPILALALVRTAGAQAFPDPGARVRVQTRAGRTVGVLDRMTPDTLVIDGQKIARAGIRRFEVHAGTGTSTERGMAIGTLAGGAAAATVCIFHIDESAEDPGLNCMASAFGFPVLGFVVGGIAGVLTQHDLWRPAALGSAAVTPVLHLDGRMGIAIRMRF